MPVWARVRVKAVKFSALTVTIAQTGFLALAIADYWQLLMIFIKRS
jgi:hypothetical protein